MKKIFTLLLLALFVQFSYAQEETQEEMKNNRDDINTIFSKENLKVTGGYISPEIKVGNVNEDVSLFVGGRLGMILNDHFTLGIAGYGLANNSNFKDLDPLSLNPDLRINMGYGGLLMEYTFFSNKKIHFSIPVVVGAAGIYIYEDDNNYFYNNYDDIENSAAFVVEPGVNIEFNLFKFLKLDLGASYRIVTQTSLVYLEDEDLSDLSINATFKFGFF
ncbi:MAG: outer membrane beta-barrel protein [Bacteroidales bacterium]|nr:outer membrane beta-barrel protein [Bacteroidales bacterium]